MKCSAPSSVRGRPREFDPDQALTAALRVFWERGYEGASMADLTSAMGIAKPSLYACFGNKEALFRQALALYERDKLAYIGAALEAPTAIAVAERLLRGALETHCSARNPHGCLGVISTVTANLESGAIRDHVAALRVTSESAIAARFSRAQVDGDLPGGIDPAALAGCLTTVIQGLSVKAQGGASWEEQEAAVATFLAIFPKASKTARELANT